MSKNGNILLVANWDSGVGYAWWLMENFWRTIADHFIGQGMQCHLIYPRISRLPAAIAESSIKTHELSFQDHSLRGLCRLFRFVREHDIRYIYLTDAPSYSWLYVLLKFLGVRKIVVHDHTPGDRTAATGLKKSLKRSLQASPLVTADHFIGVTSFVVDRLINVACIPASKCSCAENGITPIELDAADRQYAFKVFNIPAGRQIVITTGRASRYKGIDFFIECANQLINIEQRTEFHFLFCGDGPDIDAFKKLAAHHELGHYFTFAGNRQDIRDILPSCHIGFQASKGEVGYSLSILEYMSAGLVTLVPDRPSTSLATVNGINGLVYQADDIASATSNIKIAADVEAGKAIRANAIKAVKERYNLVNTNSQLIDILERVF